MYIYIYIYIYRAHIMGLSRNKARLLGRPAIRMIVFWGLYWVLPLIATTINSLGFRAFELVVI